MASDAEGLSYGLLGILCNPQQQQQSGEDIAAAAAAAATGSYSAEARVMRLQDTDNLLVTASSLTGDDVINTTLCSATNFMVSATQDTFSGGGEGLSPGLEALIIGSLSLMIAVTIVGNVLVVLSVLLVKKLRHPSSNYLLVSLAISDLCVATLVMPFALYSEISLRQAKPGWNLGPTVCNMYVSFDVTCCTASILNLCVISIDRYLAITRPLTYGVSATTRRTLCFIASIWVASCLISVPPLLLFGNEHGSNGEPACIVSQNIFYQLYATLGSFYIPLTVMIVMYYKIYIAAKRVVDAELKAQPASHRKPPQQQPQQPQPLLTRAKSRSSSTRSLSFKNDPATEVLNGSSRAGTTSTDPMPENGHHHHGAGNRRPPADCAGNSASGHNGNHNNCASRVGLLQDQQQETSRSSPQNNYHQQNSTGSNNLDSFDNLSRRRASSSALRERKASITLGVIMTAFTVCWLPFFILALLRPFSHSVGSIPDWVVSMCQWLGYANSMLNPMIYVTFHQDFRRAFKYLLCLQCSTLDTRLREEAYQSQYGHDTSYSQGGSMTAIQHHQCVQSDYHQEKQQRVANCFTASALPLTMGAKEESQTNGATNSSSPHSPVPPGDWTPRYTQPTHHHHHLGHHSPEMTSLEALTQTLEKEVKV